MQSLVIVANSAWSTLVICDRQARRDTATLVQFGYFVTRVLSSQQAIQTYRCIWSVLQLLALVAIALGATVRQWCDRLVESCLESSDQSATPTPDVSEVEPVAQFSDAVVSFKRRSHHPAWENMTSKQIAWRNAHGHGRHVHNFLELPANVIEGKKQLAVQDSIYPNPSSNKSTFNTRNYHGN